MSSFAQAFLDELDDNALDRLAELLAPRIQSRAQADGSLGWLNVAAAAEHLACPKSRLYALVSANRIPYAKDGSRVLFDRTELDKWVRLGGGKRP